MSQGPDFEYVTRGDREVVIKRGGRVVTTLRGQAARELLVRIVDDDPQQLMPELPATTSGATSAKRVGSTG